MNFCCRAFEHWYRASGTRGFGAFAAHIDQGPAVFVVQHRALDAGASPPRFQPVPALVGIGFDHSILSVVRGEARRLLSRFKGRNRQDRSQTDVNLHPPNESPPMETV
jgi:hypothetical protein